jgi:hypothetical protein
LRANVEHVAVSSKNGTPKQTKKTSTSTIGKNQFLETTRNAVVQQVHKASFKKHSTAQGRTFALRPMVGQIHLLTVDGCFDRDLCLICGSSETLKCCARRVPMRASLWFGLQRESTSLVSTHQPCTQQGCVQAASVPAAFSTFDAERLRTPA